MKPVSKIISNKKNISMIRKQSISICHRNASAYLGKGKNPNDKFATGMY